MKQASGKSLSVFSLVMINIIAIDSLRNLPIAAEYGFSLVFFYLAAGLLFFIPVILVVAELATVLPKTGGIYIWVREAFGSRWGFFVIWLQWVYNIVWYPTILVFLATTVTYLINPAWGKNPTDIFLIILSLFWLATFINCLGIRAATIFSTLGALVGTLLPLLFIIALAVYWLFLKQTVQIDISWQSLWPKAADTHNLGFFTVILFGLVGMELSAVHAGDVKNPRKDFPRALLISGLIILSSLILASLAIAIVIPHSALNIVSGLIAAYKIFFDTYNLHWMTAVIAGLIVLGGLSGVGVWILGPARSLMVASEDGNLPHWFAKKNRYGAPMNILIMQGLIFSLISGLFLFLPTVKSSYWLLSTMSAQFALVVYIMMFAAAIYLRKKLLQRDNCFLVPGKSWGLISVCCIGTLTCLFGFVMGFLPPSDIAITHLVRYEALLIIGMLLLGSLPFLKSLIVRN